MVCPVGKITFKTSFKILFKLKTLPETFDRLLLIASVVSVLTYFFIFNTPLIVSNCAEFKLSLIVGTWDISPVDSVSGVYSIIKLSPIVSSFSILSLLRCLPLISSAFKYD